MTLQTNTVDVLVVATQAAVDAANGMVALQSSAKLAISQANLAHSSSNTGMQLRLIGADSLPDRSVRVVRSMTLSRPAKLMYKPAALTPLCTVEHQQMHLLALYVGIVGDVGVACSGIKAC